MEKEIILIVDDEINNITLLKLILKDNYTVRVATNSKEALERTKTKLNTS